MSRIYKGFVTVMVLSLLGVFYYMDHQTPQPDGSTESSQSDVVVSNSPVLDSAEDDRKSHQPSLSAQRLIDVFDEATIVAQVESIDPDGFFLKREILLTDMKYPLIQRDIRFVQDDETGKWVPVEGYAYVANQVMIGLKSSNQDDSLEDIIDGIDAEIVQTFEGGQQYLLKFKHRDVDSVEEKISELELYGRVAYAEPNYLRLASHIPNDSRFKEMWALHNEGQSGGRRDADIHAVEAWDITKGDPSVVVAVVDSGIDLSHPDLDGAIYRNSNEILNGIDDDQNGYVDDLNGWNFSANGSGNSNPQDDESGHGTHVSGTIAARGDNNQGIIGVAPRVSILPIKVIDDESGFISDLVSGLDYATSCGADVVNISLGGSGFSQTEQEAINRLEQAGTLIVVASGNDGADLDEFDDYPVSYENSNIIGTLATSRTDRIMDYSNHGSVSVDVGAPGDSILSTFVGGGYKYFEGTSMSAPHVAGIAALIKSISPGASPVEIKNVIMEAVDVHPSLVGKCGSGGRVNAERALSLVVKRAFYPFGTQITIRSNVNGKYVRPDPENGNRLIASGESIARDTIFSSFKVGEGRYVFRSLSNGLYMTSTPAAEDALKASKNAASGWEIFSPIPMGRNLYAIQANANLGFVSADLTGDVPLIANRHAAGVGELFVIEPVRPLAPGTRVVLQSIANLRYISVNPDGFMIATDVTTNDDNVFDVGLSPDGYITLKSALTGYYVSAEDQGNLPLVANRLQIGDWEKFLVLFHEPGQFILRAKVNHQLVRMNYGESSQLIANTKDLSPHVVFRSHLVGQTP